MENTKANWCYYNHAMVSDGAPHEIPDLSKIEDGSIWRMSGNTPLLARWTSDFDCGYETEWWYVIKDAPYVFDDLAKSQRKHIRQALKKVNVQLIDINMYVEDIYRVHIEAIQRYKNWDKNLNKESFIQNLKKISSIYDCWGAFSIEDNKLIGYMTVMATEHGVAITSVAKFSALYLNTRMSDAMYHTILEYYLNEKKCKYISSGERSISHITQTQEYKIENFQYRKAYCKLNIRYNPKINWIIKLMYPFRSLLKLFDFISIIHQLNAVLKMEKIVRGKR